MRYFRWTFRTLIALLTIMFLHYTLPQRDIVRITGTEIIRQDFSSFNRLFYAAPDAGNNDLGNRDLRLINTVRANGKVMVYRNEDTGFGWPPYFKLDSSNLQAEASDAISTRAAPEWYAITHYGWRNEFFTIYPNAVGLRPIAGPDMRLIPWVNILILTALVVMALIVWRLWRAFRHRYIEPLLKNAGETWDSIDERTGAVRARVKGLWGRLRAGRGRPRS